MRLTRVRTTIGVLLALLAALVAANGVQAASFAAKASVDPQIQYLNDTTGTVFTFTIDNTGTSAGIGAVEIDRPSNQWTIVGCPLAPTGWSATRSDDKCRYRSAESTSDDIKPGTSSNKFQVKATTLPGGADRTGTWKVIVSKSNQFDNPSLMTTAASEPPGLGITVYSWQILDAIVDGSPSTPGSPCPAATAANHSAITGSAGHTIVICGKNRMTVAATPVASRSSLAGTFIGSVGSFSSGSIPANSASSVVLGTWSSVKITSVAGTGKTIVAKIGSASNQNSPSTTLNGYEALNRPPVAANDSYSTNEDTSLNVAASGVLSNDSDPDGNPITAVLATGPAHGTLTLNANGSFSYTPAANYNGSDSFTYKAQDSFGAQSSAATVNITINPVNDAPVASGQSVTTDEDTAKTITLSASDVDGNSLTFSIVTGPAHGTLGSPSGVTCLAGTCSVDVAYTPAANYNGSDSFTFKANDGALDSNVATVSITVNPVNDAPVAVNDSYSTNEDTALNVTAASGVLANDSDVESDPLTALVVAAPAHGTLTLNPNGSFSYTPATNYNGSDSFTYKANDGQADSNVATVSITINPVNDAPVAVNDSYSTNEDTALTVPAASGVLANDTDVDGDTLTAALVTGPAHGTLTLNADGSFSYTPNPNYNGSDSFTYKANDGALASNVATVSITINPVNDAPVAVNDSYDTNGAATLTVPAASGVLANDTDVESDPLTAVLVAGPSHASSFTLNSDGSFSYTANTGTTSDSFTYKANDGTADSNVATVTISINAPPVAPDQIITTNEDTAKTIILAATDTDGDATTFSIVAGQGPAHGTLGSIGSVSCDGNTPNTCTANVTYTPDANYNGSDSFQYTANDGHADSAAATVSITINPVNDTPTDIALAPSSVAENLPAGTTVGAFSTTDPDAGDSFTYSLVSGAGSTDNGSFTITGGTLKTAASFDFETKSSYSIRVQVKDSGNLTFEKQFTISVTDANDAPTNITLSPSSVDENQPSGTTVGTLSATDPDAGDTHTFTLVTGAGDTDNASFTIDGSTVKTAGVFDFEAKSSYSIRVQVKDSGNLTFEKQLTISITNVNEAPTDIALAPSNVDENLPVGTTVGTLSTSDPDAGDTFTYALVSGTGSEDNGSFTIVGSTVKTAAVFDFETKNSYSIRVRSTDSGNLWYEKYLPIIINNQNDPPVLANVESAALGYTENDPATTVTSALTVSDQDSTNLTGATVQITGNCASGEDVLGFTDQNGISGSYSAATCLLTLSGNSSVANYQTALRSVTYANTSDNPNAATRTITFQADDGAPNNHLSNLASRQVSISAVDDAPANSVPATQTVNEDTELVFSAANSNAISVADVDAGSGQIKATVSALNGTITPATGSGATIGGSGTSSATIQGTLTQVNAALNGLKYKGTSNYNSTRGAETLTIVTDDQGNTGTGGPLSATDTVDITVNAVNDAPVAAAQSYGANSIQANMKRSIAAASGLLANASDPDTGDGGYTAAFTLGSVNGVAPSGGTINTTIAGVGTVSANASTGAFDFDPAPGVTGNVSFNYTVCDSGNPAPPACSAAATVTFNISGPVIWFVNPTAGTNGDGRLSSPFNNLASAAAVDSANQIVFVYTGTASGGFTLNSGESLIGQGVSGASFDAVTGITPPANTLARPTVGGTRPTIQGNVVMAGSSTVRGLNIQPASGTAGLTASGATGLTVGEVSVTTTSAAAVNLSSSGGTISLTSVSANGGSNGILLNNTTGTFTVTGNGGTCTAANTGGCSGGEIKSMSGGDDSSATPVGTGIVLNNAQGVSLTRMWIHDHSNYGIRGVSVTGFTLDSSVINGTNGTDAPASAGSPYNEGSIKFDNLAGSATISNSAISGAVSNNVRIDNTSATLNRITFSNDTIGCNSTNNGEDGILLESENTGVVKATVQNTTFTCARGDLFNFVDNATSGAADDLIFNNNTLSNNHPAIATGGGGTTISSNGTKDFTFHMESNTFRDANGHAVLLVKSTGSASYSGTFTGNTIGVAAVADSGSVAGSGIKVQSAGGGTVTVAITNNQIRQYNNFGIELLTGGGATAQSGNFNATVTGNTISNPGTGGLPMNGIHLNGGTVPNDTYSICAQVGGAGALANTINGSGANAGTDVRLRQRQSTTVRLPGYGGANNDNTAVQNFLIANNITNPTAQASNTVGTGGNGFVGGAACATPST